MLRRDFLLIELGDLLVRDLYLLLDAALVRGGAGAPGAVAGEIAPTCWRSARISSMSCWF